MMFIIRHSQSTRLTEVNSPERAGSRELISFIHFQLAGSFVDPSNGR